MNSKVDSLEEKVKLPPTETISRCYQPQHGGNRKVIRILTVAVYVLCVSLAAIMLSLYYIFIWDPTIRPFVTKGNNCEKIVIPEKIAIRLINSSEVTAEQFYRHILNQYRILHQLQLQRQQFLQNQHKQLQQLAASGNNKFQEIFATATIIQANPNERLNKPITPTNGTYLLDVPLPLDEILKQQLRHHSLSSSSLIQTPTQSQKQTASNSESELQSELSQPQRIPLLLGLSETESVQSELRPIETLPILDTAPSYIKRRSHRKHNQHHRRNRNNYMKKDVMMDMMMMAEHEQQQKENAKYASAALNPPSSVMHEPVYTSLPIPLILNSNEDKRPATSHHNRNRNSKNRSGLGGSSGNVGHRNRNGVAIGYVNDGEKRINKGLARKRPTLPTVSGYDAQSYMNPFLNGELIFEK